MPTYPKLMTVLMTLVAGALALGACAGAQPQAEPTVVGVSFEGDTEAGLLSFNENCLVCHSATLPQGFIGPSLYEAGDRLSADYIQDSIREPHRVVASEYAGATPMPADLMERLSDQDLANIAAYLLAGQP